MIHGNVQVKQKTHKILHKRCSIDDTSVNYIIHVGLFKQEYQH